MKCFAKTFVITILAVGALALAACQKDDLKAEKSTVYSTTSTNGHQAKPLKDLLLNTYWSASKNQTYYFWGTNIEYHFESMLYFTPDTTSSSNDIVVNFEINHAYLFEGEWYHYDYSNQFVLRNTSIILNDDTHLTFFATPSLWNPESEFLQHLFEVFGNWFPINYERVQR